MESYIYQLHCHIKSKRLVNLGVRYATVLDLLLIAKLLRSGTFEGAISEQFTKRYGTFNLFIHLLKLLYMQCVGRIGKVECLAIIYSGRRDIGLIQVACSGNRVGAQQYVVKIVSILQSQSPRHCAIIILNAMIDLLSKGSTLQAYCSQQSKTLKASLRELTFVTNENRMNELTLFTYQK